MSRWHKHDWDFLPERAFAPRPSGGMTLEGSKGSSAPAPDPRLVEAQIKSMGIQDSAIQRILAQSEDMAPVQKEQTQFALDTSKAAWEQSQADRDYALGRRDQLSGLQDVISRDAKTFNTEAKREELAGQAGADVSQAYAGAQRTQAAEMARMGINPSDGKYGAASNALTAGTALATAQAKNGARTAARAEGQQLTDRAANVLSGYPTMGMQTTGQGAGYGTNAQMIANTGLAGLNSGFGAAGSMAGQMGGNATNMWGAQASREANMQSQETTGGILGGIGGVAAGLAKTGIFSDPRLKTAVTMTGRDERTGLALYEFSYLADSDARRYHGVMADEVRGKFPDAVQLDESGYLRVDYQMLGIEFKEVA